jgi:plastocyanin
MTREMTRVADGTTWQPLDWKRLAALAAGVALVGHLLIGAAYRDLDAIFVAASVIVAFGLTRVGRGKIGMVVLGLAFANVAIWTLPAAVTNLSGGFGFVAVAVPGTMAVAAITGLAAAVGAVVASPRAVTATPGALRLATAAGLTLLVLLGAATLRSDAIPLAQPEDQVIVTDRTEFSVTELSADAGMLGVRLENRDYFWHTFTIAALDVDLWVPVGASGRVEFEAAPGTYEYVCAVPGHDLAGMVGTLTVTGG